MEQEWRTKGKPYGFSFIYIPKNLTVLPISWMSDSLAARPFWPSLVCPCYLLTCRDCHKHFSYDSPRFANPMHLCLHEVSASELAISSSISESKFNELSTTGGAGSTDNRYDNPTFLGRNNCNTYYSTFIRSWGRLNLNASPCLVLPFNIIFWYARTPTVQLLLHISPSILPLCLVRDLTQRLPRCGARSEMPFDRVY